MTLTSEERRERIEVAQAFCERAANARHGSRRCAKDVASCTHEAEWLKEIAAESLNPDNAAALFEVAGRWHSMAAYCERQKASYDQVMQSVIGTLDTMPRQDYARLLTLRYVEEREWQEVADTLCYSLHHTHGYMRRAALLALYDHAGLGADSEKSAP